MKPDVQGFILPQRKEIGSEIDSSAAPFSAVKT